LFLLDSVILCILLNLFIYIICLIGITIHPWHKEKSISIYAPKEKKRNHIYVHKYQSPFSMSDYTVDNSIPSLFFFFFNNRHVNKWQLIIYIYTYICFSLLFKLPLLWLFGRWWSSAGSRAVSLTKVSLRVFLLVFAFNGFLTIFMPHKISNCSLKHQVQVVQCIVRCTYSKACCMYVVFNAYILYHCGDRLCTGNQQHLVKFKDHLFFYLTFTLFYAPTPSFL